MLGGGGLSANDFGVFGSGSFPLPLPARALSLHSLRLAFLPLSLVFRLVFLLLPSPTFTSHGELLGDVCGPCWMSCRCGAHGACSGGELVRVDGSAMLFGSLTEGWKIGADELRCPTSARTPWMGRSWLEASLLDCDGVLSLLAFFRRIYSLPLPTSLPDMRVF